MKTVIVAATLLRRLVSIGLGVFIGVNVGRWLYATFLSALLLCASIPVYAQERSNCGPRADIIAALEKMRMIKVAQGDNGGDDAGLTTEVYALPDGRWIIIVSRPDDVACMVAGGLQWTPPPIDTKSGAGI